MIQTAIWDGLSRELDAWRGAGISAALWWRDDDASDVTSQLERLLDLSGETSTPAALAVIPLKAQPRLADFLASRSHVSVLQHGFRHINHAPNGAKKSEFGPRRLHDKMLSELAEGHRLMDRFANALPVLAPPWNRIDPNLLAALPGAGIAGLSCYGPRVCAAPAPGLRQVNAHVDPINWRGGRRFIGARAVLTQVAEHLSARRAGLVDACEPTGFLTHHLAHDENFWEFFGDFLALTHDHPAVRWIAADEAFGQ